MAKLRIPDRIKPVLLKLALMPKKEFDILTNEILNMPLQRNSAGVIKYLEKAIKDTISDLDELISALISMSIASMNTDSVDKFVANTLISIQQSSDIFSKIDANTLKERLLQILSASSLILTANAIELLQDYENIFCRSKIISDIRPIFGKDANELNAAIIVHNLKVEYHHQDKNKEIFLALDNEDLLKLKKEINEAELRVKTLEDFVKKSEIKSLKMKKKLGKKNVQ